MYNAGIYSKQKNQIKITKNTLLFNEDFKKENFTTCYDMTKSNYFDIKKSQTKTKNKLNIYLILDDGLSEEDKPEFRETFMTRTGKESKKVFFPNIKRLPVLEHNNDLCKIIYILIFCII